MSEYQYIADTDYLLAGIWLTMDDTNLGDSPVLRPHFAYRESASRRRHSRISAPLELKIVT